MKKTTGTMVARRAGVAQSTVSLVMNNSPRVEEETRQRVIEAARALGYPLLPRNQRLLIGVIISRQRAINSYQAMTLSALKDVIYERGYRMEIICHEDLSLLNERVVSGAICITGATSINLQWKQLHNIPLIHFNNQSCPLDNIYTVYTDYRKDNELAFGYLRRLGHRRVGLFLQRSREEEHGLLERTGEHFREMLSAAGIDDPERLITYSDDGSLHRRCRKLLSGGASAFIVIPGDTCLAVCQELRKMRLRVPADVSIISREYRNVFEYLETPLTALLPDYDTMAAAAIGLIERFLNRRGSLTNIAVPSILIRRKSVCRKAKM